MKQSRRRLKKSHTWNPALFKRLLQASVFLACFFVLGYGGMWLRDPAHFPITSVNLIGEREHIPLEAIKQIILPEAESGFFRLEVAVLQQQLMALPWMKRVAVRRIWPDRLVIQFEEYRPISRWGDDGLISQEGKVFYPDHYDARLFVHLPQLKGPSEHEQQVWDMLQTMNKLLAPDHLTIQYLELAPRGAWQCRLSNGIKVILGTEHVLERFKEFLICYQNTLHVRSEEIAYADLRYTSGMALGWKRH